MPDTAPTTDVETVFPPNEYVRRRTAAMLAGIKRRERDPLPPPPPSEPAPVRASYRGNATPGVCRWCKERITWDKTKNDRFYPTNPDGSNHMRSCTRHQNGFTKPSAKMKHTKDKTPPPLDHYALRAREERVAKFLAEKDGLPPPKTPPGAVGLKPLSAAEEKQRTIRLRR